MTTSEQRAELVRRWRVWASEWEGEDSGLAAEFRRGADALEASEAEKQRLIETVRYVSDTVIDYSYASVQLERACDEAEAQ